jgi:hypothetical protein
MHQNVKKMQDGMIQMAEQKLIKLIIILIMISLSTMQAHSRMIYEFNVDGKNATMSSYTYFKQPRVEESGYTRGMKEGSFNYLVDGDIILKERLYYDYGKFGTNDTTFNETNSSLRHTLTVNFNGEKGISEFYGKQFLENNRAVSAWKKIRYEDIRFNSKGLPSWKKDLAKKMGGPYLSNIFNVTASLNMDMTPGKGFTFEYNATIKNGVIETKDSVAWTNKTNSQRIEWEQEALIRGKKINVTNNLRETGEIIPASGSFDWLPCCLGGTIPRIEGLNTPWPSAGVLDTLKPSKILPSCTENCITSCKACKNRSNCTNCTNECIKDCNWTCKENDCPGFECINTYEDGPGATSSTTSAIRSSEGRIFVNQFIKDTEMYIESAMVTVTYDVSVTNQGYIKLTGANLTDILPKNMTYISALFLDGKKPKEISRTTDTKTNRTTIVLGLGELDTGQAAKHILITASYSIDDPNVVNTDNRVVAEAYATGNLISHTSDKALEQAD